MYKVGKRREEEGKEREGRGMKGAGRREGGMGISLPLPLLLQYSYSLFFQDYFSTLSDISNFKCSWYYCTNFALLINFQDLHMSIRLSGTVRFFQQRSFFFRNIVDFAISVRSSDPSVIDILLEIIL